MKNPWTKKNPFLSMWLSGANAVAGAARGRAVSAAKAQTARAVKQGAAAWFGALSKAMLPGKAGAPAAEPPARPARAAKPARKGAAKTTAASRPRRRKAR